MTLNKTPILLLIVIGLSYVAAADYTEIPSTKYSQYPLIPTLRTFGINSVLSNALASGKIKNTQFSLFTTNHIYIKPSGSYVYYKFDLSLKNVQGDVINTIFEVRYETKTKKQLLTSLSYNIKYAPTNGGNGSGSYVLIPSSEYGSSLIQSLANFGKDYVVSQAIAKNKLPSGVYTVTLINSVKKQAGKNVTNYRFDVVFEKDDGSREVEATYDIAYTLGTGKMAVIAFSYNVLPYNV